GGPGDRWVPPPALVPGSALSPRSGAARGNVPPPARPPRARVRPARRLWTGTAWIVRADARERRLRREGPRAPTRADPRRRGRRGHVGARPPPRPGRDARTRGRVA